MRFCLLNLLVERYKRIVDFFCRYPSKNSTIDPRQASVKWACKAIPKKKGKNAITFQWKSLQFSSRFFRVSRKKNNRLRSTSNLNCFNYNLVICNRLLVTSGGYGMNYEELDKRTCYFPRRYCLIILTFFGLFLAYLYRVILSICIIPISSVRNQCANEWTYGFFRIWSKFSIILGIRLRWFHKRYHAFILFLGLYCNASSWCLLGSK